MTRGEKLTDRLSYSNSARRNIGLWGCFIVGSFLIYSWLSADPQASCSRTSECASWLAPVILVVGFVFALTGLVPLLTNPKSGSRIDPETGALVWWQNRTATYEGDGGSIDPADIGRIRIIKRDESADQVYLYDRADKLQPFFNEEVVGDVEKWAEAMEARWPHIEVAVVR